jgi:hypothetical protein
VSVIYHKIPIRAEKKTRKKVFYRISLTLRNVSDHRTDSKGGGRQGGEGEKKGPTSQRDGLKWKRKREIKWKRIASRVPRKNEQKKFF